MSQKQQEPLEEIITDMQKKQQEPLEEIITDAQETPTSGDNQPDGEAPQRKRRKRKGKWVSVEEILPKPSYWPLALTVSIRLLLMGVIIHPIVIGVGAVLVIVSVMGWMLERR